MQTITKLLILFALLIQFPLEAQTDSLESVVKSQNGTTKIKTLSELCYQYSAVNIKKSIAFGRQAFSMSLAQNDSLLMASVSNDLSLPYLYYGNFDSCIWLADFAYQVRLRKKQVLPAANSLSKVALGYYEKGDLKNALKYNFEVEKIYNSQKEYLLAAKIQNNIGSIFEKNGQVSESISWYQKSADMTKQQQDWSGYITAQGNLGIAERKLGNINKAEKILLDLIPLCEEKGKPEQMSQIYQALGVLYRELNNTPKGLEYYLKARKIYAEIGTDIGLSSIDANIGNCYRDMGDLSNADKYLQSSLKIAKESKSWSYMKTPLEGLYALETKKGDFKKANDYLNELILVKDSLYSEDTKNKITDLQVKYETAEKENKLLQQENEINRGKEAVRNRNYWILGLLLMCAVVGIIGVYLTQKQIAKKRKLALENKLKIQEERIRISRDLHDNMGAEITLISSLIDTKAYQSKSEMEKLELQEIANLSRKAMSNLRETIWTISDEFITIERLGLKINEFAEKICAAAHIEFTYGNKLTVARNLEPALALNLFRMSQELINNSVKHAAANKINLEIESLTTHNKITITDNGKGFELNNIIGGNGLRNLEQRAKESGVELEINSTQGVVAAMVF